MMPARRDVFLLIDNFPTGLCRLPMPTPDDVLICFAAELRTMTAEIEALVDDELDVPLVGENMAVEAALTAPDDWPEQGP